ncbi:MAG: hydantoinase/oxoprolinase family protein, partial [Planctomycetota bacterium]
MSWLGIDIGGANIKAADGSEFASSRSFALWKHPELLSRELRSIIADAPSNVTHLAATMTGELADCFESKKEGVCAILDAFEQAADGRHTRVYLTNGKLVTPEVARRSPMKAAASNWCALAAFCSRFVEASPALAFGLALITHCDMQNS